MKRDETFYEIAPQVLDAPNDSVFEFGKMLASILRKETNMPVDTGAGFNEFDLWAKYKGREFFIAVKLANKSMN